MSLGEAPFKVPLWRVFMAFEIVLGCEKNDFWLLGHEEFCSMGKLQRMEN